MTKDEARKLIEELTDEEVLILREMLLSLIQNREHVELPPGRE